MSARSKRSNKGKASPAKERSSLDDNAKDEIIAEQLKAQRKLKIENKKEDYITELIQSEGEYIADLEITVTQYMNPLSGLVSKSDSTSTLLSPNEIESIFLNLPDLLELHKNLLSQLSVVSPSSSSDPSSTSDRSTLILPFFEKVWTNRKVYVDYCNSHRTSTRTLSRVRNQNKEFAAFLDGFPTESDLSGLLLSPVLRMLKYPRLLAGILKHSEPSTKQYSQMDDLLRKYEVFCGLDEASQRFQDFHSPTENLRKLQKIEKSLSLQSAPKGFVLIEEGRRFLREGPIIKEESGSGSGGSGKGVEFYFYLFNDIIIWCKKAGLLSGKSWSFVDMADLSKVLLSELPGSTTQAFQLTRADRKLKYILRFKDPKTTQEWLKDMKAANEKLLTLQHRAYRGGLELDLDYLGDIKMRIEAAAAKSPHRRDSRASSLIRQRYNSATGSKGNSRSGSAKKVRPTADLGLTGPVRTRRDVPDDIDPEALKEDQEYMRQQAIDEVVQSEKLYVRDLQSIIKIYLLPMREEKLIPAEDIDSLFCNLEAIVNVNKKLLVSLEERMQAENLVDVGIGDLFVSTGNDLKIYTKYCNNHPKSVETMWKHMDNTPAFAKFVEVRQNYEEVNKLSLADFLIKPVQRILKYKLLISELLRYTDYNHPDNENLIAAKAKMDEVSFHIDSAKGEQDNDAKVRDIEAHLNDCPVKLATDVSRKFYREGDMQVNTKGNKWESRHFILFEDLLIIAKPSFLKRAVFNCQVVIKIPNMVVKDLEPSQTMKFRIQILDFGDDPTSPETKYIVAADTLYDKKAWLKDLLKLTEKLPGFRPASTSLSKPSSLTNATADGMNGLFNRMKSGSLSSAPGGLNKRASITKRGSMNMGTSPILPSGINNPAGRARTGSTTSASSLSSLNDKFNAGSLKKTFIKPAPVRKGDD